MLTIAATSGWRTCDTQAPALISNSKVFVAVLACKCALIRAVRMACCATMLDQTWQSRTVVLEMEADSRTLPSWSFPVAFNIRMVYLVELL